MTDLTGRSSAVGFETGHSLGVVEWPGSSEAPPLLLAHATGFTKETWLPVVAELRSLGYAGAITAFDQPAHGTSTTPPPPYDWREHSRAVHRLELPTGPLVGVGHSSGGALLVLAELEQPSTFHRLVLIEPVILPPPHGRTEEHPLVGAALKRRATFASPAEAAEIFASKPPFDSWDGRALDAYIESGLRYDSADAAWVLACDPEAEAEFYRTGGAHDAWSHLDEVRCPVTLVAGSRSVTHPPGAVEALAARFPAGRVEWVADAGHFVPMERPREVAALILRDLAP